MDRRDIFDKGLQLILTGDPQVKVARDHDSGHQHPAFLCKPGEAA
jgi:hypothetical protein